MPLAEVIVRRGDRGAVEFPPDDVTTRFEAAITERGPVGVPIVAVSKAQMHDKVGDTAAYTTLRAAESYFDEGGTRVVLSRVVGPAARVAVLALRDRDTGTVVTLTAAEQVPGLGLQPAPGAWYHAVRTTIEAGRGDERIVTITLHGATLATGACTSAEDLQDLARTAGFTDAAIGAGTWPVLPITDQPLAGGDDDLANVRDADVIAALTVLSKGLGPGSVCASGWTSVAVHTALAAHANANTGFNRFARCDLPDVASAATLISQARQIRALDDARYVQLLAGWPTVTIGGVTVPVPPSGHLTGREARTDRENRPGPGQPCAWTYGELATAVGVSRRWSRSDRQQMLDVGITILVQDEQGRVYAEDAVTAVDPARYPQYAEVSAMRVTMAIHNQCETALRPYVRRALDGHGHVAAEATKDLVGICAGWYARDALYGDTSDQAFAANVIAEVTPGRRSRLVGHLELRPSPSVQTVELTITQVAASDNV